MNPTDRVGLSMLLGRARRIQWGGWRANDPIAERVDVLVNVLDAHLSAIEEGGSKAWRSLVARNPGGARQAADAIDELEFVIDQAEAHFDGFGVDADPGLPDQGAGREGPYVPPRHLPITRAKQRELVRKKEIWCRLQQADTAESEGRKDEARRIRVDLGIEEPEPRDDAVDSALMRLNGGDSSDDMLATVGSLSAEQRYVLIRRLNPEGMQAWDTLLHIERDEEEAREEMERSP